VRIIGGAILVLVALRVFGWLRFSSRGRWLLPTGGAAVGFLSGLAGSAGPLGAAVFLSLELPPVAYIASEAFTALAIHATKTVIYQRRLGLDREAWLLASAIGAALVLGTWISKRTIQRLPPRQFQRFVTALLVIIALYMLMIGR